ncbi:isochorismate synthase DhbC [Paenibacillus lentus]|uniref:isochorismate synthase n=1 Tax=Paenibacillus lentus TaxID=1338368 RepID=A0A3Q8S618_9BACL|nr:isochorismate synthase DhbC [Paenibacillus lentus]AZK47902.1 isochorismate synthase DhbC [Paenibacillus lentus]
MVNHGAVYEKTAAQLLEEYESGLCFFLSSPKRTLLAKGEWARLWADSQDGTPGALSNRVKELLAAATRSHSEQIVVGAIPFDLAKPAELIVPLSTEWAASLSFSEEERSEGSGQFASELDYEMNMHPDPEFYKAIVNTMLERLKQDMLQKVVLSRTLELNSAEPVDTRRLLRNLARHNEHGYTFAVNLGGEKGASSLKEGAEPAAAEVRTLLGASPELLITKTGLQIRANPLAGSAPRSNDPVEDERRAAALLASAKDQFEHRLVVEAVEAALRPYCKSLDVPAKPSLVQTQTMWHLSTDIYGELADSATNVLDLALSLHPTPAICGTPTELAREAIREIEPFERGFFTGMVGWCDSQGDGEWIVTIRCAEVEGRKLRLYAGAGIVADSSAEAELAETAAKFRTLLLAMGLNDRQLAVRKKEGI